jgi:hypothetical protein
LTALMDRAGDDDWILEDVPRALGMIGAPAVRSVARYLGQVEHPLWGRISAAGALADIGQAHPDAREECVATLTDQLRVFREQDTELNAFLISSLVDLHAAESASLIAEAFAMKRVDLSVNGDWEDVQVKLGLLSARVTPASRFPSWLRPDESPRDAPPSHATRDRRAAEKRRRKIAKKSKRRNRRRR